MRQFLILTLALAFYGLESKAEGVITAEDYARADSTAKFDKLVYHTMNSAHWLDDDSTFWYSVRTRKGTEYKIVNVGSLEAEPLFDQEKLCAALNTKLNKEYEPYALWLDRLRFQADKNQLTFNLGSRRWEYNLGADELKDVGVVPPGREPRHWMNTEGAYDSDPVMSPDSSYTAFVREYNLYIKETKGDKEYQLSYDGSEGEFYSGHVQWSPDSKKLAAIKVRDNKKHYIYYVESSPEGQLQPKLKKLEYQKPGDDLPIEKPCLFDVATKTQIKVNSLPFENQFSLSYIKWWPGSEAFTFEFNQRGHQLYQVVEVSAETGETRILVEEKSNTFIDYSGKHYRYDCDDTKEIIWASERDGWNHLYLVDAKKGKIKKQITKGEWVVRGVDRVDPKTRTIIFKGSGKNEGEDPYFIHYYSVNFDGSDLKELTPEKMNHSATFSGDYQFFTDTYSTVDTPPVTVLRKTATGETLMTVEEADITALHEAGWKEPVVFVAKARDDETDIWGNIYFPTDYDSTKIYPVVEYIYAGPHGSFAQKSFRPYHYYFTGLAELGFIIVQMDGMGTSNRSKAFQDVCYQNLKDAGFPDRIKWIKAAAEKFPAMDTTRIGIFGASAGAQSAMGAVLFHPEFYKAASAACGCHDNRMDKIWWNEQWMGYPVGEHYAENSNMENAGLLKGDLQLIVGEMDDNVDPASTMQVADALIKAKKDFELIVLPGAKHTLGGDYGEHKRRDFFIKSLYRQLPPNWKNNLN